MKAVAYTYFSGPVRVRVISKVYDTHWNKWCYNCIVTPHTNRTYKRGEEFYSITGEIFASHRFKGYKSLYTGRIDFDSVPLQ